MSTGYDKNENVKHDTSKVIQRSPAVENGTDRKEKKPYAHTNDRNTKDVKGTTDLRDKTDKSISDRPTTASAQKGLKDLPSVIGQVGKAAVHLQNMYPMMASVTSILAGLSSSNDDTVTTSGKKQIIEGALLNAIIILTKIHLYEKTIRVLENAIAGDSIEFIDKDFRDVVTNSINEVKSLAEIYGPNNIPEPVYLKVTEIGPEQTPVVTMVPDLYTQEYYTKENDPYPGYIKWVSVDDKEYVFTKRNIGDNYYTSATEEARAISETEMVEALNSHIEKETLTSRILNDILLAQNINVGNNIDEKTVGKGSSSQSGQELLQKLLGFISTATNLQKSVQLPQSVLNQGSVKNSLKKYEETTAKHKKMQQYLDKAF